MTFTTYIIIGLLFGLLVEWVYLNLTNSNFPEEYPLENWMRVIYVLTWPLAILVFINGFIKGRNNKNKEK